MDKSKPARSVWGSASSRLMVPALLVAALAGGLILGRLTADSPVQAQAAPNPAAPSKVGAPGAARAPAPTPAADDSTIERVKIDPTGCPTVGPENAAVTLVEFVDYQCPFCGRASATVRQLHEKYGDRVRLAFCQNPLSSIHADASLAAQAALAAGEQGHFLEMHELMLANQTALKRSNLEDYAARVGLDVPKFRAALDSGRHAGAVQAGVAKAASVGATATPFFFVNGRVVRGALPLPTFERLIEEELSGKLKPTRWVAQAPAPQQRPSPPPEDPNKIYTIDLADSVSRGPANAPVTLVEFTDFQCPFCARGQETVQQILQAYPDKVRIIAKNLPLSFHNRARAAAIAALAASNQGKYWEYRQLLFTNQRALGDEQLRTYGQQVGLDMARFERDLADPVLAGRVDRDLKQAEEVGVSGTPTFFLNGRKLTGAQPFETFKAAIDQHLAGGGLGTTGSGGAK